MYIKANMSLTQLENVPADQSDGFDEQMSNFSPTNFDLNFRKGCTGPSNGLRTFNFLAIFQLQEI